MDYIDPAIWDDPTARRALAERDITTVYRLLGDAGVSQRQLAALTGQSQSEVCEILGGRRVKQYDTLLRVVEGLGVERGRGTRLRWGAARRSGFRRARGGRRRREATGVPGGGGGRGGRSAGAR